MPKSFTASKRSESNFAVLICCEPSCEYRESIRTKTEVREEILKEIKNENKAIYETEQIKQLEHNTTLMKKWMKKNPKDAEKFLKFKEGYESR
jgi:hypothetical protein